MKKGMARAPYKVYRKRKVRLPTSGKPKALPGRKGKAKKILPVGGKKIKAQALALSTSSRWWEEVFRLPTSGKSFGAARFLVMPISA